jgi:hypothetical protein
VKVKASWEDNMVDQMRDNARGGVPIGWRWGEINQPR